MGYFYIPPPLFFVFLSACVCLTIFTKHMFFCLAMAWIKWTEKMRAPGLKRPPGRKVHTDMTET